MDLSIKSSEIKRKEGAGNEGKVNAIQAFLNEHYDILINCFDRSKSIIRSKDPERYDFNPDFNEISLHIFDEGIPCPDTILRKILRSRKYTKIYNPITDYFEHLKGKYQGKSHIDILANHLTAYDFGDKPDNYYQERLHKLLKKWLVASAACSMGKYANPVALGIIHEDEGIGKSFLFQYITPPALSDFWVEYDRKKMDMMQLFAQNMFIVFDELDGINDRTADRFKTTLQKQIITVKHPHDPIPEDMTRIGNACFTSNMSSFKGGFLTEKMGYRRFGSIQLADIKHFSEKVDVDQIWAETLVLLEGGFNYVFEKADFDELKEYNAKLMLETPAMKLIRTCYTFPKNGEGEWKQASEVYQDLLTNKKIKTDVVDKVNVNSVGYALRNLKFEYKSKRLNGESNPAYRYNLVPLY